MIMNLQPLPSSQYLNHTTMPSSISDGSLSTAAAEDDVDDDDTANDGLLRPSGRPLSSSLSMPLMSAYADPQESTSLESRHGTPNSSSSCMMLDTSLHSTSSAAIRPHHAVAKPLFHTDSSGCISSAMEAPQVIPQHSSQHLPTSGDAGEWAMDTTEEDWPAWSDGPSTATSSSTAERHMVMMGKPPLSPGGGAFGHNTSCSTSMAIDIATARGGGCDRVAAAASSHQQEREMLHFLEDLF